MIRTVQESDAQAILDIYAPYVAKTAITFEITMPSLQDMQKRIQDNSKYGWLVYEIDQKVVAYAYGSKHRDREAYQWCCEVSVYVNPAYQQQGVAHKLYTELFKALREKGYVNSYAGITLPNIASVKLHESMGFEHIGIYKKIGKKFDQWHDVGWWGLRLS